MRIVKEEKKATMTMAEKGLPPSDVSKTVKLGIEDLILAIVMIVLAVGYVRGQLTIQEFLTYLGVTGAGGLWGMLGGTSSSKT